MNADLENKYQASLVRSGVPEHLHGGLIRYFVHHIEPGGFLIAVLENNLSEAMGRADEVSRAGLYDLVRFLYNDAPSGMWGSPAKVRAWLWTVEPSDSGDPSVGVAPTPPVVFTTIPNREGRSIEIAIAGSTIYDNSEDGDPLTWGDPDANARLIAAAPDLKAVCVDAENWFDNHGDPDDPGAMGLLRDFRAAIAKAEGR